MKRSLADIICDNTNIPRVRKDVFNVDYTNIEMVECGKHTKLNGKDFLLAKAAVKGKGGGRDAV